MKRLVRPSLALPLLLAACGGDPSLTHPDGPPGSQPDAAADSLTASGTVVPAAGSGPIVALWSVSTATDYLYKFGEGTALAGTFDLDVTGTPPAMARIHIGATDFGVATLVVLPPSTSIPDGVVDLLPAFTGISARDAIVYRAPGDPGTQPAWLAAFPVGLSCGRCVDSASGFDTFAPAACDGFAIADLNADVCNWY